MNSKHLEVVQKWIDSAANQDEFLARLVSFTENTKANAKAPAKAQALVMQCIEEIAIKNGRAAGGVPSLGDHILVEQAHKIARYGERAFCLSEKQMAVIVRENWDYLKA